MHWNYDMETMPFPMHVCLSRNLIDAGASGVIGSHSHVPHAVEVYKGKPIAYRLGNFYLPSGIYFDGNVPHMLTSKTLFDDDLKNVATNASQTTRFARLFDTR